MVMGCVPVSWACCAMRAVGSIAMELGRGRREVRFGAVEVRRGSREELCEVGAGADIVGVSGYVEGCLWVCRRQYVRGRGLTD